VPCALCASQLVAEGELDTSPAFRDQLGDFPMPLRNDDARW
jgi:hypothetical protein